MDRSRSRGPQTDDKRLQTLAETFQGAWSNATSNDLLRFLPPDGDPLRPAALIELVKADLKMRWQRKKPVLLEAYLKKFTELGKAPTVPAALILEEYMVRQLHGDKPDLATYQHRFPAQYPQLEDMIRASETRAGDIPPVGAPSDVAPARPTISPPPPVQAGTVAAPATPGQPQVIEGYTLFKKVGSGSFAEVWRGEAPGGFPVAIKRIIKPLDDDQAQRELLSLESIKNLRHLFLLQTHRTFLLDNQLYVVMELADGTLRDRMKQCQKEGRKGIPLHELMRYFRESAEALDYMHSQNILHRDIKPHNILILNGHAKVADFGLAMLQESQQALMSASGSGTPAYMAPEVWKRKISKQSDQYSLAFAYAEQRLGHWPFTGKSMAHLMMEHLNKKPELDPLSAAEQAVIHRALAKEPEERYPSCLEFVAALEEALADELGKSKPSINIGSRGPQGPASKDNLTLPLDTKRKSVDSASRTVQQASIVVPRSARGMAGLLLFVLMLLAAGGGAAWYFMRGQVGPTAPFALADMAMPSLRAGEVGKLPIRVSRAGYDGPIEINIENLPSGCSTQSLTIPAGQNDAVLMLEVPPDAGNVQDHAVTVRARGGPTVDAKQQILTIKEMAYALPPSWKPVEGAKLVPFGDRLYYDQIDVDRDGIPVRFLLIPQARPDDPPTFYIMQDKVWVGLFRKFVADPETKLKNDEWDHLATLKQDDPEKPVMGVVIADADQCARWLGGRLPRRGQWEKAAGAMEPDRGQGPFEGTITLPYRGKDEFGVQRGTLGPMKRSEGSRDVVPKFGCRQMASNGLEWLSEVDVNENRSDIRTLAPKYDLPAGKSYAFNHSASFKDARPMLYTDLAKNTWLWAPEDISDAIGFRIVLDLK